MLLSLNAPDTDGQKTLEHEDIPPAAEDGSLLPTETSSQLDDDDGSLLPTKTSSQLDDDDTRAPIYRRMKQHEQNEKTCVELADIIYESMLEMLGEPGLQAANEREQRLRRTENLIAQDDSELEIDDCIRWWILYIAIITFNGDSENEETTDETIDAEKDPEVLIIYIITKIAPYLAFEFYNSLGWISYDGKLHDKESRCKFPHRRNIEGHQSPFQLAVNFGRHKAIRHMIAHGSAFSWGGSGENTHDMFLKILKRPHLTFGYKGYSALRFAAEREERGVPMIKVLLNFDPDIAAPPDSTFEYALEKGRVDILRVYIQYERLRDTFITHQSILRAMELYEAGSNKVKREDRIDIIKILITHIPWSIMINFEIIEKVIYLNSPDVWHMVQPLISELNAGRFLHFAVRHQSVQLVDLFLREYPDSVTYQWEGKYALWHNNNDAQRMERFDQYKSSEDELTRLTIRDMLASAIVKTIPTISGILYVFHKSEVVAKEICLDLSGFQSTTHSMSDLFHGLMNQQDHSNLLSYEQSLRYVEFPALALVAEEKKKFDTSIQSGHKEIFDVLEWLRDTKGVKDICELIVRDRLFSPHNEVEIGDYVGRFNVESLNWKMLDMSISIFEEQSARNITELCLYASGKRAVISHWLSSEGVSSLPRLEVLNIYVIQDLMTKENYRMTFAYVSHKFSELSEKINEKRRLDGREELFVNVNIEGWDPVYEEKLPELEEISERIVPKLSQFTKTYCNLVQILGYDESCAYRPTRIAIIDNGMLDISSNTDNLPDLSTNRQQLDARHSKGKGRRPNDGTLWSRIKEGRSFVDDGNRVSQWFLASDPHGTQMARIIGSIDPCCDLYVARVAREDPDSLLPGLQNFALRQTTDELQDACLEASKCGIAMLCSAHDEGTNLAHAYPADFADTITITTCDEFGTVPPRNRHQSYEYAIDGQNVPVGIVPFLNSGEYVSGSSVATAIAAGLSSLILSCNWLARREEENYGQGQQAKIVKHHLQKMAVNESKFVQPEKFAGIDRYINDGRDLDIETILRRVFLEDLD